MSDEQTVKNKNENYEKNLKLNLEAKRKDLDNITTSIIPSQLTLIRMFLWLSFSVLGAVFYFTKLDKMNICQTYFLTIISAVTVCIVILCLLAIKESATRLTAHLDNAHFQTKIEQDDNEHVRGLWDMLDVTTKALDIATESLSKTAKLLRYVTYLSLFALFLLSSLAIISVYSMKGGVNMAEENKDTKTSSQADTRPVLSSSSDIKPNVLQANNRVINNESIDKGFNITADDKSGSNNNATDKKDEK